MVGRTPLKSKQIFGSTPNVASKRVSSPPIFFSSSSSFVAVQADLPSNQRTPLATARRAGMPHLPTGKTPLHNSTMKTRAQLQTSKRQNMDLTPSTIVTPVKQRRIVEQMINNTTANASSQSLAVGPNTTATAFKSSMTVRVKSALNRSCLNLFSLDNTSRPTSSHQASDSYSLSSEEIILCR